jgi:2-oxoglutarate dehydrogenase E2 component (dihydrolipoamide succinyltransferase)
MATEIIVPILGESVTEATVAKWFKAEGDAIAVDEPILELETDKVTLEVNASAAGTLTEIAAKEGENVEVGALLGTIGDGGAVAAKKAEAPAAAAEPTAEATPAEVPSGDDKDKLSPAVRKLIDENNLDA